jgi:SpoVK/Ycf46/Vps4 family AAA+-type ATPase
MADKRFCSPPSPSRFPAWQREYEMVLHETDTKRLFKCIEVAESAVLARLEAIGKDAAHNAERKAIDDVLTHLSLLKRERLGFTAKKPALLT